MDISSGIFTFLSVDHLPSFTIVGQTIARLLNVHEGDFRLLFIFRILDETEGRRLRCTGHPRRRIIVLEIDLDAIYVATFGIEPRFPSEKHPT